MELEKNILEQDYDPELSTEMVRSIKEVDGAFTSIEMLVATQKVIAQYGYTTAVDSVANYRYGLSGLCSLSGHTLNVDSMDATEVALEGIKDTILNAINWLIEKVQNMFSYIREFIQKIVEFFRRKRKELLNGPLKKFSDAYQRAKNPEPFVMKEYKIGGVPHYSDLMSSFSTIEKIDRGFQHIDSKLFSVLKDVANEVGTFLAYYKNSSFGSATPNIEIADRKFEMSIDIVFKQVKAFADTSGLDVSMTLSEKYVPYLTVHKIKNLVVPVVDEEKSLFELGYVSLETIENLRNKANACFSDPKSMYEIVTSRKFSDEIKSLEKKVRDSLHLARDLFNEKKRKIEQMVAKDPRADVIQEYRELDVFRKAVQCAKGITSLLSSYFRLISKIANYYRSVERYVGRIVLAGIAVSNKLGK